MSKLNKSVVSAIGIFMFCVSRPAHASPISTADTTCALIAGSNNARGGISSDGTRNTCIIHFGSDAYANAPVCAISAQSTLNGYVSVGTPSASSFTMGWQTAAPRNFYYQCKSTDKFRGTNVVGMEILAPYPSWSFDDPLQGPVANSNYPVIDSRTIAFYASKHATIIRLFFSWEGMQSVLNGPIPAYTTGNYQDYFTNYMNVVSYANQYGIKVIVEPWQGKADGSVGGARYRGALVGDPGGPTSANFADFWGKMAAKFVGYNNVWFGLMNEPNNQDTMQWFSAAQAAVTAIRGAGATQKILVPGNDYTRASSWAATGYSGDTGLHSNAYGWMHANGGASPLFDPLSNMAAEVHQYLDAAQSGNAVDITSYSAARTLLSGSAGVMNEARAQGYQVFLGEIGFWAGATTSDSPPRPASDAWADFLSYLGNNSDTLLGYTWWAGGQPGWWGDVSVSGTPPGGHFSITPTTTGATYSGDTVNMTMIGSFL